MRLILLAVIMIAILSSCGSSLNVSVDQGVTQDLAINRKQSISFLSYDLAFNIPLDVKADILGSETIGLKLKSIESPIILDFNPDGESAVSSLSVNDKEADFKVEHGHLIVSNDALVKGYNEIKIEFIAGSQGLNRSDDFLYTLFVPNKASSVFPCLDQPDLKAKYKLQLSMPEDWIAVSSAKQISEKKESGFKTVIFEESALISTYLFSFTAGKFEKINREQEDFAMNMYHRETDQEKVVKNVDQIFQLHYDAIKWLEEYTDIKYPYDKMDFVLVPAFQFSGMEHVGATLYNDSKLLLDHASSQEDEISRSLLIAHEVAHSWFGNLVTMEWFDDVWLKEVFANLMASKIAEQQFPDLNHELMFLFKHYPLAYSEDRSDGANAIRRNLTNLQNAGSMYGNIVYHKAPIVMRQLELQLGEFAFRESLREYLENFSEDNANWNDLLEIMNIKTDINLKKWSEAWIEQAGMPLVEVQYIDDDEGNEFDIVQYDLTGKDRVWPQQFRTTFGYSDGNVTYSIDSKEQHFSIRKNEGTVMPQYVQLNADGLGYGIFSNGLDYDKENFAFNMGLIDYPSISDELRRGTGYINLHEYLLHEGMNPLKYLRYLEEYIYVEENEQILTYLLENLELIYWKFLTPEQSMQIAPEVESLLVQKMDLESSSRVKHLLFKKFISMAQSELGMKNLMNFWTKSSFPNGLDLTENEHILLAYNIEIKANQITGILEDQLARIENPDRRAEFEFVSQALSIDAAEREVFFNSLLDEKNREREEWVLTALHYLNHPLRTGTSVSYLEQALQELPEIQKTGDIFFPKRWLERTLWGHNSAEAVEIINNFLGTNKDLDPKLREKLLQATDLVFRAERDINSSSIN
ncbi:MAG: hypothetical protein JXQ96_07435 [Cyclobacteriaceae bacterium]